MSSLVSLVEFNKCFVKQRVIIYFRFLILLYGDQGEILWFKLLIILNDALDKKFE